MIRCNTCGRHLAGLRHDHPEQCALRVALVAGRPPELPTRPLPATVPRPRIQIREGEIRDPLMGPSDRIFTLDPVRFVA